MHYYLYYRPASGANFLNGKYSATVALSSCFFQQQQLLGRTTPLGSTTPYIVCTKETKQRSEIQSVVALFFTRRCSTILNHALCSCIKQEKTYQQINERKRRKNKISQENSFVQKKKKTLNVVYFVDVTIRRTYVPHAGYNRDFIDVSFILTVLK